MEVRIWQSFSSNNSSDYSLVAVFGDAKTASSVARELATFFKKHAAEQDKKTEEEGLVIEGPSKAAKALADKHGFKWSKNGILHWGDQSLSDDLPHIETAGSTVVVYHTYCGGYGKDLPKYIKARGGKGGEDRGAPSITVRFQLPPGKAGEKLAADLAELFNQRETIDDLGAWDVPWGSELPYEDVEDTAWCQDGDMFEFFLPYKTQELDELKMYLKAKKAKKLTINLCDYKDLERIKKAAEASQRNQLVVKPDDVGELVVDGKKFLFTGKLAVLTRAEAKARVKEIGGVAGGSVSKDLDYLVVGDEGSPLFGEGAKGSKIVAAEKLIAKGAELQIISENTFMQIGKSQPKKVVKKKVVKKKVVKKKVVEPAAVKKVVAKKKATTKKVAKKVVKKKVVKKKAKKTKSALPTQGKKFLFTGKLASMTRAQAKARLSEIGGVSAGSVSKDLDYLVIGDEGSPLFGGGKKGSKMIAAEKLIEKGAELQIISETTFLELS